MQKSLFNTQIHARKTLALLTLMTLAVMLATCIPAAAQSDWRLFGGISYVRFETIPQMKPFGLEHISSIGWGASLTQYMSWAQWFGFTAELSGAYKKPRLTIPANYFGEGNPATNTEITNAIHASTHTAMYGPSFAYRKISAIEPFAHILLGAVNEKASLTSTGVSLTGTSIDSSGWAFATALGGGADIKISKLLAVRGQADWIRSTFQDGEKDRQNNIRVMGGLVFRFSE